ncbi:hypothetical protein QQY66_34015 [Streptomyces sp. DG2A-72]|uniref:hypothetical protein n=1 Tax=Streptomyces sp. DG2A-72 TaxID=3051386 RepID=UPI00265BD3A9|nr:hypothetical protein [Streptomyces sp. DG2A-72]MDO0936476.1 hypothetical protein [Streptomyces sp. DG2A-72]
MSVVSHLYHGELSDWCEARLPGSSEAARHMADQVRDRFVTRPEGAVDRHHWSQAGRAFTLRLAALIQPAPPYAALLGLAGAGLVSRSWADAQAARYPTHAGLPEDRRERALDMRPTPSDWIDLKTAREAGATVGMVFTSAERGHRGFSRPGLPDEPVLGELFNRMRDYFTAHAPLGRLGGPGQERGLARLSWILAAFQYAYRNNSIEHPLFRVFREDIPSVEELHRSAHNEAIADPLALTQRLITSGALEQMRRLAGDPPIGTPWGINCPVIFDHWDDHTFVLDGPDGATLLEIASVVTADVATSRARRRIWKLLAGAWLDTADTFRIRTLAVYFARHGVLVVWPVASLTELLLEGRDPQEARNEFVGLATCLRDKDRARRSAWRAGRDL